LQETIQSVTHAAAAGASYGITLKLPYSNSSSDSCYIFLPPGALQLETLQESLQESYTEAAEAAFDRQPAGAGADGIAAAESAAGRHQQQQNILQDGADVTHHDAAHPAAVLAEQVTAAEPLQRQAATEVLPSEEANTAASAGRRLQATLQSAAAVAGTAEQDVGSIAAAPEAGLAELGAPPAAAAELGSKTASTDSSSSRTLQQFQYHLGIDLDPAAALADDRFIWGAAPPPPAFVMPDTPVVAARPGLDPAVKVASLVDYPVPIITLPNAGVIAISAANPLQLDGSESLAADDDSIVSWAWAVRMISPQEIDISVNIMQSDSTPTAWITLSSAGSYVVGLTVQSAAGVAHFNNSALIVLPDSPGGALVQPSPPLSQYHSRAPPPPPRPPRPPRPPPPPPR
jgi:hypothetical protein